ncbi:MAG: shikimate dehydrogenase [Hyphomonadaceae bacterium]
MTRLYGVIGDPIAQSLSPMIHRGWMREHDIDAEYLAMQIPAGELEDGLGTLARRGASGLNVTMPHKHDALALAGTVTPRAKTIGAANTLWRPRDGTWHADNTDAPGFLATLAALISAPLRGQRVAVLGAGGAARAIVYALHSEGASILLANRTLARAENLIAEYGDEGQAQGHQAVTLETGLIALENADFVVNTTSLGFQNGSLDLPAGEGRLFYDISYGKAASVILTQAKAAGWRIADGLPMLVYQAAFSFERWFGILPETGLALERARTVIDAASG